jgi:hypothetical protein
VGTPFDVAPMNTPSDPTPSALLAFQDDLLREGVQLFGFYFMEQDATATEKVNAFMERFGAPDDALDTYHPVFLVDNHSTSGEVAASFGLFIRDGVLHEVHGSECSVWDFDGQWEPEETSLPSLRHRLTKGTFGQDDNGEDQFRTALLDLVSRIPAMMEKSQLEQQIAGTQHKTPRRTL